MAGEESGAVVGCVVGADVEIEGIALVSVLSLDRDSKGCEESNEQVLERSHCDRGMEELKSKLVGVAMEQWSLDESSNGSLYASPVAR